MAKTIINLEKEAIRGAIKQIMRVCGLRTISLSNYNKFKGNEFGDLSVHSIKLNLMDGYLYLHSINPNNGLCGPIIENPSDDAYREVFSVVNHILTNEGDIPSKIKRNILVRVAR